MFIFVLSPFTLAVTFDPNNGARAVICASSKQFSRDLGDESYHFSIDEFCVFATVFEKSIIPKIKGADTQIPLFSAFEIEN